ncbi:hypothetical protein CALCODRAFT_482824 [Calocera cornea HHB12733]|uniref:Uncharacterized protein n=1 Tax=Calocera cornea HHB12733 TaxID=1353952 RepID=A0A165GAL3_9BASI|nr:hypothetical protein CALCODRAFT_482824 [Calocera cornea HHB12733]
MATPSPPTPQTAPEQPEQGSDVPVTPTSIGEAAAMAVSLPTSSDVPTEAAENGLAGSTEPERISAPTPASAIVVSSASAAAAQAFSEEPRRSFFEKFKSQFNKPKKEEAS